MTFLFNFWFLIVSVLCFQKLRGKGGIQTLWTIFVLLVEETRNWLHQIWATNDQHFVSSTFFFAQLALDYSNNRSNKRSN